MVTPRYDASSDYWWRNQTERVVLTANLLYKQSRITYILQSSDLETVTFFNPLTAKSLHLLLSKTPRLLVLREVTQKTAQFSFT
jgi:hypothetical protein